MLASKQLIKVHPNVLALSGFELDTVTSLRAALLQAGPDAALSHTSALYAYGLLKEQDPQSVHVSVPRPKRSVPGVTIHQRLPGPVELVDDVPVVSVKEALVGSVGLMSVQDLRFPAMKAVMNNLITARDLADTKGVPRRAMGVMRMLGEEALAGAESGGEANFFRLLEDSPLPTPTLQVWIDTHEGPKRVDAYWEAYKLAAEVDSREFHAKEIAFEEDPVRRNAIQAQRVVVINFVTSRIMNSPTKVIEECEANLYARAADLGIPASW